MRRWVWILPWVAGVFALVISRLTNVALNNMVIGGDYDFWFTYSMSLIYMVKPYFAAASMAPLTEFYPEYWLTAPLAWLSKLLHVGVAGYIESEFAFNAVFNLLAFTALARRLGRPWWVGVLAYTAAIPTLWLTVFTPERGLMVGLTALMLLMVTEAEANPTRRSLLKLILFTIGFSMVFPYTVFFTFLTLALTLVFTLITQRRLSKAIALTLVVLAGAVGVRLMILHVAAQHPTLLSEPIAYATRWWYAFTLPQSAALQLPGEYPFTTMPPWKALNAILIIYLALLLTLLYLITNAYAILDPLFLSLLILMIALPYPYTLGEILHYAPFLSGFFAFHTLNRFHAFLGLLLLLAYGNPVDRRNALPYATFSVMLLIILSAAAIMVTALPLAVTPVNSPFNQLTANVPLPNGTLVYSPELAFTELNPPIWLRFYYPPMAPGYYPHNMSLFLTLARLEGVTEFIIPHGDSYTVVKINDTCPFLRVSSQVVVFNGTGFIGNTSGCPILQVPESVIETKPYSMLLTEYAFTHDDASALLGNGAVDGAPPLLAALCPIHTNNAFFTYWCRLVLSNPNVYWDYSNSTGLIVVWGIKPSTFTYSTYPKPIIVEYYAGYDYWALATALLIILIVTLI